MNRDGENEKQTNVIIYLFLHSSFFFLFDLKDESRKLPVVFHTLTLFLFSFNVNEKKNH